jgi:hypothetical protein
LADDSGDGADGADAASASADFSLTNSRRGLLAMQVAVLAGDRSLVERVAALVGDPPDATYVGPDSVVCTQEEQGLAYALKAYLLGRTAVAYFHTAGLATSATSIRVQAVAIDALIRRERQDFLSALAELLAAHADLAVNPDRAREPRRFVAIPALALAALALDGGIVTRDQLPDDPYLPLSLLPLPPPEA